MTSAATAPADPLRRLHAILGTPGLMIGVFSLLSFGFGLIVSIREYDRLRQVGRETMRPAIDHWVRTAPVHYLGWTLPDAVERWRRSPGRDQGSTSDLARALETLGDSTRRSPVVEIVAMDINAGDGDPLAAWTPRPVLPAEPTDLSQRVAIGGPVELAIRYRLTPEFELAARGLEVSYRRLLLAVLGLSGYSLLCLGYMVLHARALRDRVARESAQAATLDLADRTCHELGNVAFVLANERRNLSEHLALVERFVGESPDALASAIRRAGLEPAQSDRLASALRREYEARGIDPGVELRDGARIAADVCRQISVCSQYIALTVRELDAYLKQSSLPASPESLSVEECLDDALALLGPSLESSGAQIERVGLGSLPRVRADRRLLVHALVNLLKNAIEAAKGSGRPPRIRLEARIDGKAWISVADDGPGIAPEALSKIFDVGYSTKGAGRGRGLAIVRESIDAQGGEIRAESQVGRGTTFRIGLPLAGTT